MSHDPNETRPLRNWPDQLAPTLARFEQYWQSGRAPQINQFLSAGEDQGQTWDPSARSRLLGELIKLDLEYRWRSFVQEDDAKVVMSRLAGAEGGTEKFECWLLEDYLRQHPQLGTAGKLPLELVLEEYRVRQLWGDSPGHQEYVERFPELGSSLVDRLSQLDSQLLSVEPTQSVAMDETQPYFGQAILAETTHTARGLTGVFGDYELIEEIARGGMGVVYKARQVSLDREVAVKMILSGQLANDREVRRFYTEAEAAARLQHPHIVAIHEVGELQGQHYFSMDFIGGGSLAQRVADGPLPVEEAAELVNKVATAIEYAHQQGILHRDLKPQNILMDTSDQPWVTDFGLAKRIEGQSDLTGTGQVLGTPSYMPPEQAASNLAAVGPASDVYSIGAILYELVTGRPPFRAATAADTVIQVRVQEPVAPRLLNGTVPRDLETIILKCLEKELSKRYASAAELSEELVRYLEGRPIQARPVGAWERGWRWCRRKPAVAGMWALAALLLMTLSIGGPVVALYQANLRAEADAARAGETKERGIAEIKTREATKSADQARRALLASQRQVYLSDMLLAQRDWEDDNIPHLRELLDRHKDEDDIKGFEWHYWKRLCDTESRTVQVHAGSVHCLALSADGKRIVSGSADKTVKVWDVASGQEMMTLDGHNYPVNSVSISPNGEQIASGSMDTTVIVWNAETGQQMHTLAGHRGYVMSVSFSPDGKRIVSGGGNTVKLWDALSGKELLTMTVETGQVYTVAFSPDGKRIVSGSTDNLVKLWDAGTGEELQVFKGHDGIVNCVTFSPDGMHVLSASSDKNLKVWYADTGQEIRTLEGHTDAVQAACFSADGKRIVSASKDRTLKVWNANTGEQMFALKGHSRMVRSVMFIPGGNRIVSAGDGLDQQSGELKLWQADTDPEAMVIKEQKALIWSVAFAPDGKWIATGSADKTVKIWNAAATQETLTLRGHNSVVASITFDSSGQRIATTGDNTVKIWNAQTGELLHSLDGHNRRATSVSFSPGGKRLASGSWDKTIKIWEVETGRELLTLKGHANYVKSVAFSPDGKRIVSASTDKTVRLWDLATGKQAWSASGHTAPINSVTFSPNGKRIASGGADKIVNIWDAETGEQQLALKGQNGVVFSVAFSPDGKRIAAGNYDSTVKFWDLETGQETLTLKGHSFVVTAVAFSPDGKRIVSTSWDKTIRIWDARPKRQE